MVNIKDFIYPVIASLPFIASAGADIGPNLNNDDFGKIGLVEKANPSPNVLNPILSEFADKVEKAGIKFGDLTEEEIEELKSLARKVPVNVGLFTSTKIEKPNEEMEQMILANPGLLDNVGHGFRALHVVANSTIEPSSVKIDLAKILLSRGADPNALTFPTNKSVLDVSSGDGFKKFLKTRNK